MIGEAPTGGKFAAPRTDTRVPGWVRPLLLVIATVEALEALSSIPVLFGDLSEVPGPGLGGFAVAATIAVRPFFVTAALVLAFRRAVRLAIMALAGAILLSGISVLPSAITHGLDFHGIGGLSSVQVVLSPTLAIAAGVLACKNMRIALAGSLVVAPTLLQIFGILAFAASISLYGF